MPPPVARTLRPVGKPDASRTSSDHDVPTETATKQPADIPAPPLPPPANALTGQTESTADTALSSLHGAGGAGIAATGVGLRTAGALNGIAAPQSRENDRLDGYRYAGDMELSEATLVARWASGGQKTGSITSRGHNARGFDQLSDYLPPPGELVENYSVAEDLRSRLATADGRARLNDRHYIRTEVPSGLVGPKAKGRITDEQKQHAVEKLTHVNVRTSEGDFDFEIEHFSERATDMGVHVMECAGNDRHSQFGLMSAAAYEGVPIESLFPSSMGGASESLFEEGAIPEGFTHIRIEGFDESHNTNWSRLPGLVESTPGAGWVFSVEELVKAGAFFATSRNGEPLRPDHGGPLRLVVPGAYGCASIKWIDRISFETAAPNTETTSQQREFADRTHQDTDRPRTLGDLRHPTFSLSATPVRVERWEADSDDSQVRYRVMGLAWGQAELEEMPALRLEILKQNTSGESEDDVIYRGSIEWTREEHSGEDRRSFMAWTAVIDAPSRSSTYDIRLVPVDEDAFAPRLTEGSPDEHYRRRIRLERK